MAEEMDGPRVTVRRVLKFKTHCIRGHELSPENVVFDRGQRRCRTCKNEQDRRLHRRKKAGGLVGEQDGPLPRPTLEERFWQKVEKTDGCWFWRGSEDGHGYGTFGVNGKTVKAHRFAYMVLIGPIPEGLELDHVKARGCTSRLCVNPAHLEPVTRTVNMRRGSSPAAIRAASSHCKHGHKFTPENTVFWGDNRRCRTCERQRQIGRRRGAERGIHR